jgi:hypothetical protein
MRSMKRILELALVMLIASEFSSRRPKNRHALVIGNAALREAERC